MLFCLKSILLLLTLLWDTPRLSVGWTPLSSPMAKSQSRKAQLVSLSMISNVFPGGSKKVAYLPRDVKEAVSRCREATQEALKNRISRMDVEFPVGTKFGVEKSTKKKKKRSDSSDGKPTREQLQQSDRELARLFVEMFQPVGGERIAVCFADSDQADAANKKWTNDYTASSVILSMDRRRSSLGKKKKANTKSKGFAAKLTAEIEDTGEQQSSGARFQLPDNTEVAIFVAPGPRELVVIEKICDTVGMDTLVVLLNARLSTMPTFGSAAATELFTKQFDTIFHLAAAPQEAAPSCLLYCAYPGDWVLARKPVVGQPKTILTQASRPTDDECRDAFDHLELSDVEKGVENMVENLAGWFR